MSKNSFVNEETPSRTHALHEWSPWWCIGYLQNVNNNC